jgi:hypothetical protein
MTGRLHCERQARSDARTKKSGAPPIRLRSGQAVVALPTRHFNFRLPKRLQLSVRFGLGFDDIGIGTYVAIESPDPVVIERVRSQTSYGEASHIANIPILIARHVRARDKGIGCGDVQAVTGSTADTCPVRSKAVESLIGVL